VERNRSRNQELCEFGGQNRCGAGFDALAEAGKLGFDWVWLLRLLVLLFAVCLLVALGGCVDVVGGFGAGVFDIGILGIGTAVIGIAAPDAA